MNDRKDNKRRGALQDSPRRFAVFGILYEILRNNRRKPIHERLRRTCWDFAKPAGIDRGNDNPNVHLEVGRHIREFCRRYEVSKEDSIAVYVFTSDWDNPTPATQALVRE
jgi:hypothetical protein